MSFLNINGFVLKSDRISAVLSNDSKVAHHSGKNSTVTYFFTVIIDGQRVDILCNDMENRDMWRSKLLELWENSDEKA